MKRAERRFVLIVCLFARSPTFARAHPSETHAELGSVHEQITKWNWKSSPVPLTKTLFDPDIGFDLDGGLG